jgi:hypothetical protein
VRALKLLNPIAPSLRRGVVSGTKHEVRTPCFAYAARRTGNRAPGRRDPTDRFEELKFRRTAVRFKEREANVAGRKVFAERRGEIPQKRGEVGVRRDRLSHRQQHARALGQPRTNEARRFACGTGIRMHVTTRIAPTLREAPQMRAG